MTREFASSTSGRLGGGILAEGDALGEGAFKSAYDVRPASDGAGDLAVRLDLHASDIPPIIREHGLAIDSGPGRCGGQEAAVELQVGFKVRDIAVLEADRDGIR